MSSHGRARRLLNRCQCQCGNEGCQVRRRERKVKKPVNHGTRAGYDAGCDCSECRAAANAVRHEREKRENVKSANSATNKGKEWTGPELELVMRDDLTRKEIAVRLGRTISAVKHAKYRCNHDPKFMELAGVQIR